MVKIVLGVIGIIIVAGFIFIGVEVYKRAMVPDYAELRRSPDSGARAETALNVPAGARIESLTVVGSRLAFVVRHPQAGDSLYVMDALRGRIIAVVRPAEADTASGPALGVDP